MKHSTWRTRRTRQLVGEAVEHDQEYVDARPAGDLGQAVHDRRIEFGRSRTELAERAGTTQPQAVRIATPGQALDGTLNLTTDDSPPHAGIRPCPGSP